MEKMNSNRKNIYIKFLTGRISYNEFLEMRNEINSHPDTLENEMQQAWEEYTPVINMPPVTKKRIEKNLHVHLKKDRKTGFWFRTIASVAILLLLAGSGLFYFLNDRTNQAKKIIVKVERGEKASIVLPDGTYIRLNAESFLSYDLADKKARNVSVSGEVFFDVAKDKSRPFIVDMDDFKVRVTGTTFNIRKYETEDIIETSLLEGQVLLEIPGHTNAYPLAPEEKFIFSKADNSFRIEQFDKEYELSWLTGKLIFRSETLESVLEKIERWYGVTIDLQCRDYKDDLITGSFLNEDLHHVLDIITLQYGMKYIINSNYIIITQITN
ncbi:MAG: FecR domain-containing protein [Tannerellaceae bacterium]|nr:FecR domain-containing protein [Tannerellaceae bacterium]